MKKVLFLQIKGKSKAGVWFVNKTIGEELIKKGYDVTILAIRNNQEDITLEHDERLKLHTINPIDLWEISRKKDIKSLKSFIKYIKEHKKLKEDYEKAKEYIRSLNPDYIIASHYQCLDFVPKEFYRKTIYEHHTSFEITKSQRKNIKTLNKYNNKIGKIVWLSKNICKSAIDYGFSNSTYIYNPIKFETNKIANVIDNKKIITITRISSEKRIEKMIELVQNVFQSEKYYNWVFEIYGKEDPELKISNNITNTKQIKMMGMTSAPEEVLLSSSINLNTSSFEGFSMSILEALECGVPTISFNNSEAMTEIIDNNENGFIVEQYNDQEFENKLKTLLDNKNLLKSFSKKAKISSSKFHIEKVIQNWINLFNEIENGS